MRTGRPPVAPERRFVKFVQLPDAQGCMNWTGYSNKGGYGKFQQWHRRPVQAHRFAYEMFVGPIPNGLTLDHICSNRRCVNPLHLEPVTQGVNTLRGNGPTAINARKAQCRHGHEYTEENTLRTVAGHRNCRTCIRARRGAVYWRAYRARRKVREFQDVPS